MRRMLGRASRIINRLLGGSAGETVCARVARRYGTGCLFCVVIAAVLREPDHCSTELGDDA